MEEIFKGMNLKDGAQMKQAENIWKMLDNMHQSSPEDYKKFIDKNLKEGLQEIEHKKQKENKEREVQVKSRVCYKIEGELTTIHLQEEQQQEYQALFLMQNKDKQDQQINTKDQQINTKGQQINTKDQQVDTMQPKAKFYLNILTSHHMIGPLDQHLNPIDLKVNKDLTKWDKIPLQICNMNESKTSAFNLPVYFYDLIVSTDVFELVKQNKTNYNLFFDYLLRNFQERLKMDKSPILKQQNIDNNNTYSFYQTKANTVKKGGHKYKNKMHNQLWTNAQPVVLDKKYHVNTFQQVRQQGLKHNVVFKEQTQQQQHNQVEKNIEQLFQSNNNNNNNNNNKVLIQEVDQQEEMQKELDKQRKHKLEQELKQKEEEKKQKEEQERKKAEEKQRQIEENNKVTYEVDNQFDKVELKVLLKMITKFSEVDLQVSSEELILVLKINHKQLFSFNFIKQIDCNQVQAKWDRKNKILKIQAHYQ